MEDPQPLAGAHVEPADVALHVMKTLGRPACQVRGSHDHHILRHHGRRVKPDFSGDQIDLLVVVLLQIDDAVFAEAGHRRAGLGIESDEPVAGRDIEDSLFLAVGPVGHSMSGKLPRRIRASLAFIFAMHPQQFAGGGIERYHIPP